MAIGDGWAEGAWVDASWTVGAWYPGATAETGVQVIHGGGSKRRRKKDKDERLNAAIEALRQDYFKRKKREAAAKQDTQEAPAKAEKIPKLPDTSGLKNLKDLPDWFEPVEREPFILAGEFETLQDAAKRSARATADDEAAILLILAEL